MLLARQLYFEAVKVGDELPPIVKPPVDRIQIARYAGAAEEYGPLHVDEGFARNAGFPSVLAPGMIAICPDLAIVDLTHAVPAHDVAAGAYLLRTAYAAFPHGTIRVAVVDPGVGTARGRIAVRTEHYVLVGPDNGIFSRVLDEAPMRDAYRIEASHYLRSGPAATFEGRDVFAPAAAWIARGVDVRNLGPRADDIVRLPASPVAGASVRVLVVDRFGNVILDLPRAALPEPDLARLRVVTAGGAVLDRLLRTYGDAADETPFLLFNSSDHLEIAVRCGRADRALGVAAGDEVRIDLRP